MPVVRRSGGAGTSAMGTVTSTGWHRTADGAVTGVSGGTGGSVVDRAGIGGGTGRGAEPETTAMGLVPRGPPTRIARSVRANAVSGCDRGNERAAVRQS